MKSHNDSFEPTPVPASAQAGYWIECVPLRPRSWMHLDPGLYAASIEGLPDVHGLGISPDRAIAKLKRRLEMLRALPPPHSQLKPPQRLQACQGWMSIYVELAGASTGDNSASPNNDKV
jgi:hypothetical protein